MIVFNNVEQAILQVIICFSVLNVVFVTALNQNKSFPMVFGLSFLTPLACGLSSIFSSTLSFQRSAYTSLDLTFLLLILLLLVIVPRKKYSVSLILVISFPAVLLFLLSKIRTVPAFFTASPFQAGVVICLTALIISLLGKRLKEKDLALIWGVITLGLCQALQPVLTGKFIVLLFILHVIAYALFFMYIYKNTFQPYLSRLKKAEAKLSDLNKTIHYEVKRRTVELERHNEHLLNMVQRDPLVDAYNKKGILNLLKEMVEEPGAERLTILLFDVDNFKLINDTQGHMAGDLILKKVVQTARVNIRGFDFLGRFGGDEFMIILPGTVVSDALFVAERFRKSVNEKCEISISVGVASFPEDGKTVEEIMEVADAGLYESKRRGKNAVTHYSRSNVGFQ